jgi:hypothetical protein
MLDNETDSLFRDIKCDSPSIDNLEEEYAHLIDQISIGSKDDSQQIVNVDTIDLEVEKKNIGKKSRSNSSKKKNSTSNSRPSTAMTAATKSKVTSSDPKKNRKRNGFANQQMSQLIHNRVERSGSSIRSCGMGVPKNHLKS